ncbi:hypothetical protein [Rhizobium sp. S96]|uniref:hypothetical protein n=1 Tax=Rhizobium sp. S96 TaxID=3055140 RepID=UPI0025AA9985|nr:hypothetical protein [Rhizobium sp. S96]MDM9620998.1 hypothetical protein [Rhizobium sp. S96]
MAMPVSKRTSCASAMSNQITLLFPIITLLPASADATGAKPYRLYSSTANGMTIVAKITTKDGSRIFHNDWGPAQQISFRTAAQRRCSQFFKDLGIPLYRLNRDSTKVNESLRETFRLMATIGGIKGGHDCVRALSGATMRRP